MKKTSIAAFVAATMFAGGVNLAAAQDPAPAPQTPAPQSQDRPADDMKGSTVSGELVKVDVDAETITIKGPGDIEETFKYTAATSVTGSQEGVSGLATKAGTRVTVHYSGTGDNRIATKIEAETEKPQQ